MAITQPGLHTGHSTMTTLIDRFWSKVDKKGEDECWEWKGYRKPNGYGQFKKDRKKVYAHRFVKSLQVRQLTSEDVCCHICDNPICVNPHHIEVQSQAWNVRDCWNKGRLPL